MSKNKVNKYKIGEAACLTATTASQLRFYERIGIVTPEFTDDSSKYRYYNCEQLCEIDVIKRLQYMGFSLSQIKAMLKGKDEFLEQGVALSQHWIRWIDNEIEVLKQKRGYMEAYNHLISKTLAEYKLSSYIIESIPQFEVLLFGRTAKLDNENDAYEMFTAMSLTAHSSAANDWYRSTYAYKVKLSEAAAGDTYAEICTLRTALSSVHTPAENIVIEPSGLYAKTTQPMRIEEVSSHADKLLKLVCDAGLSPLPYYYVLLMSKDKSGENRHIRQICMPLEKGV